MPSGLAGLIRERLAEPRPSEDPRERMLANVVGEPTPELLEIIGRQERRAAVLIGIVERDSGPCVLLTERAAHLIHHPGQISFPGGKLEDPAETPIEAALREAREEVGLVRADVSVLGCLDEHVTGTGFSVTPVVGLIAGHFTATPDPAEVSEAFEVPLGFIADDTNRGIRYLDRLGCRFRSYEFVYDGHRIWGATAAMLVSFMERIKSK